MRDRLNQFISEHGTKHWSFAARKDPDFMSWVMENTNDLPEDTTFSTRVYCAVSETRPTCNKGGIRTLNTVIEGWRFCGRASTCQCAAKSVSDSLKKTNTDLGAEWRKERYKKGSKTLLDKNGVSNFGQTDTAKNNHAVFYSNSAAVAKSVEKSRATMMETYGVDNALKLASINRKEIARQRSGIDIDTGNILDDPVRLSELTKSMSSQSISEYLGVDVTTVNRYIQTHGIRQEYGSSFETEIAAFLTEQNITFISRSRSIIPPMELDFFLPDHKLGIEFNGLYFHSSQVISDDTHLRKWKLSQDAGIRLLMINEDEWVERKNIIKRKILNVCGLSERGLGARQLTISRIPINIALSFCEEHHIQGRPGACSDAFGASLNGKLVSVITISPQRGTGALEMSRFCTDGKTYAGVFSRLVSIMRQYISDPIITFADLRYSNGDLYKKCGFTEEIIIRPDYRYVKRNKTFHKSLFTKNKIREKFGLDMSVMTENEAMKSLGYSKIYDCGKIRFVLP